MIIVDDVCTTGASTVTAIEAAREAGMRVIGVVCLVEREEAKGRPAVEAAAQGAPFYRLFSAARCARGTRQPFGDVAGGVVTDGWKGTPTFPAFG